MTDHVRDLRWRARRYVAGTAVVGALQFVLFFVDVAWAITGLFVLPIGVWVLWTTVSDDRVSLRSYDSALAALRACREPRGPGGTVEVTVRRDHGSDDDVRVVSWGGRDVARWQADGTVTRPGTPEPGAPPEAEVRRINGGLVREVVLGRATFVVWGSLVVDDLGRRRSLPTAAELNRGTLAAAWPAETGPEGLLAYLEYATGRYAAHRTSAVIAGSTGSRRSRASVPLRRAKAPR